MELGKINNNKKSIEGENPAQIGFIKQRVVLKITLTLSIPLIILDRTIIISIVVIIVIIYGVESSSRL